MAAGRYLERACELLAAQAGGCFAIEVENRKRQLGFQKRERAERLVRFAGRRRGCIARAKPSSRNNVVHDAASGVRGAIASAVRANRVRGRDPPGRAAAAGGRKADRLFREHAAVENRARRRSDIQRAVGARACEFSRSADLSSAAARKAGGGVEAAASERATTDVP